MNAVSQKKLIKPKVETHTEEKQLKDIQSSDQSSEIQVRIIYETNLLDSKPNLNLDSWRNANSIFNGRKNNNNDLVPAIEKGQKLLTSYFTRRETKTILREIDDPEDITEHLSDQINIDGNDEKSISISNDKLRILCYKTIRRKYHRFNCRRHLLKIRIAKNLVQIAKSFKKNFTRKWKQYRRNVNLLFVYQCIVSYHRFTEALAKTHKKFHVTNRSSKEMTTETIMINRRVQRILNDKEQTNDDIGSGVNNTNQPDLVAKRLSKSQRANDNTKLMLLTENVQESAEKDFRKYEKIAISISLDLRFIVSISDYSICSTFYGSSRRSFCQ